MGEPLLNFDAVVPALSLLRDDLGFGMAAKRVTLSTAGLVPGIDRLRDTIDVALAVSLHAPEDALRETLVPLNRKYPIRELMRSCADYVSDKHKRSVTFEYTLIDGVNDHPEHARKLVKLLRRLPSKLNLIPFNPFPGTAYRCSSERADPGIPGHRDGRRPDRNGPQDTRRRHRCCLWAVGRQSARPHAPQSAHPRTNAKDLNW